MAEVLTANAVITLMYALFALFAGWLALRALDVLGGVDFKTTAWRISSEPLSAAIYFGARFIGVCLLIGQVVS
uniref:hypothetical protein n=1 Tax=Marinobacterium profundum TaxID=1714300 RepID=UPI001FE01388|nr:hypothetical protein [Marinobacterium profundum]